MRCPYCQSEDTQVKDSRPAEDGAVIRRRRVCSVCGGRFTTFERVQLRDKLTRSIEVALRKRDVDNDRVERAISGIVRQLESSGEAEVTSDEIGRLAMDALKGIDDIAYIRFASVYRNFSKAVDFHNVIDELTVPETEDDLDA